MKTPTPFPRRRPARPLLLAVLILLAGTGAIDGAPWVTITEIHYHPPEGDGCEFIEIVNREPPRADLSEWSVDGEIRYRFPRGTVLAPGEYIVLARDPEALRKAYAPKGRVFGPFAGRLDRKGGSVLLRNAAGAEVVEARYENGGRWPSTPDGTGHTLSLLDPLFAPDEPHNWSPSARLKGTPGAANFTRAAVEGLLLVKGGETWQYHAAAEPPDPEWRSLSFDAKGWRTGPTGIGYGDGDDATELAEMRGQFFAVFARRVFEVGDPAALARLVLRVDYDDGFVAYLNGKEVARGAMGPPGSAVAPDDRASDRHEAGVPVELDLGPAAKVLKPGKNVLAIEVHNDDLASSDLSLNAELESRKDSARAGRQARPLINEIGLAGANGGPAFIEIYNAGDGELDLGGSWLSNDPRQLKKVQLPSPAILKPHGFIALGPKELGDQLRFAKDEVFLALTAPAGDRVLDALRFSAGGEDSGAEDGKGKRKDKAKADRPRRDLASGPLGRHPDGGRKAAALAAPTPGAPNRIPEGPGLVISEIMYHPLAGEAAEYLEIHNPGKTEVDLTSYAVTGGIRFVFSPPESSGKGPVLPAGGYAVLARDPEALAKRYGLARDRIFGPYRGTLANDGEEVVLRDPRGNIADAVEYADASPWPAWADGRGSSLELIHPGLDNSLAASWAASDDRSKAKWQNFTYTKEHRSFKDQYNIPEFQILLLQDGECLIDDFRLRADKQILPDGTFERGAPGWMAQGTHETSGIYRGDAASGKASYRIVAEGRGNGRQNNISIAVPGGLLPGRRYQVSFRAKWQRGSQTLLTRSVGQGIARAHKLTPPETPGTPGAQNSTHVPEAPPAVGTPSQKPILPSTSDPVTFTVRISALSRVTAVLCYRQDGEREWFQVPLADDGGEHDGRAGDGIFGGQVPAMPAGKIEFQIAAQDAAGREGFFPPGAPARSTLYAVGLMPPGKFPTYNLLMSDAEWQALAARPRLSNRLAPATLVYGDSRIFYDVGARRRGSPFTRGGRNWRIVFGADTLDGRGALTVDGQNGDGTNLNERLTYWLLESLRAPSCRQQYVYFRFLGREEGVYEDVEKIDGGFLGRWFRGEDAADGEGGPAPRAPRQDGAKSAAARNTPGATTDRVLHKVDDYFEVSDQNPRNDYDEADLVFTSLDPEDYRWNFPPRGNRVSEDFQPLIKLLQLFDPRVTPDKTFDERVEKLAAPDEWIPVLAARTLASDWDTLGRERGKNSMLYLSEGDGRWRLLPWDCDLAWQPNRANEPIFSAKFPGIRRLLERPQYHRRFLGYLAYLSERKLAEPYFAAVLEDLRKHCGARTEPFRDFARTRGALVRGQIPGVHFRVAEARRVERAKTHDVVRATGTAPLMALRFQLDGREGAVRFIDDARWTAEFPIGPEGGDLKIEALDPGGGGVASATIKVKARRGAVDLPEASPETKPAAEIAAAEETKQEASEEGTATPAAVEEGAAAASAAEKDAAESTGTRETAAGADVAVAPTAEDREATGEPRGEEAGGMPAGGVAEPTDPELKEIVSRLDSELEEEAIPDEAPAASKPARRPPPESLPAKRAAEAPAPPSRSSSALWLLIGGGVLGLAGLQVALIVLARRRRLAANGEAGGEEEDGEEQEADRDRRPAPARAIPVAKPDAAGAAAAALASPRFSEALNGLKGLSRLGDAAVPALLAATADERPTPFQKIRRAPDGFTASPSQGPSLIRVRHVAALLLERAIGRPEAARPTRQDWEARWKARRPTPPA